MVLTPPEEDMVKIKKGLDLDDLEDENIRTKGQQSPTPYQIIVALNDNLHGNVHLVPPHLI